MAGKGFFKFPNDLFDGCMLAKVNASELKVLLLLIKWTLGFGRSDCPAGLTGLANATGFSRSQIANALNSLIQEQWIQKTQSFNFQRTSRYKVNIEKIISQSQSQAERLNNSFETVSEQFRNDSPDSPAEAPFTQGCPIYKTGVSTPLDRVSTKTPFTVHSSGHNKDIYKELIERENLRKIPPSPLKGEPGDAEKRAAGLPLFSLKDFKNKKPAPDAFIKIFSEELGIEPCLTLTEKREWSEILNKSNSALYQSAFIKLISQLKGQSFNSRRPGDVCMALAKAAGNMAAGSGTYQIR
jgi:hypothetical protein